MNLTLAEARFIGALAIVAALAGFIGWQHIAIQRRDAEVARQVAATAKAKQEKAEQTTRYAEQATVGERVARQKERDLEAAYQPTIGALIADRDRRAADVANVQRRLRDQSAGGRVLCPAAGSASGSDGADPIGFLVAHLERDIAIAAEADGVADRLRACQSVVRSDRAVINAP